MALIGNLETTDNAVTPAEVHSLTTDGTTIQGIGSPGSPLKVIDNSIGSTQLIEIAANTFLGNNTGVTGPVLQLTVAQMLAALSIDDLITLSGVAGGAVNLGAFTGTTITSNSTVKTALQELETALEAIATTNAPGWVDVGNGVTLLCTAGIDSGDVTKVTGVVTVTVPAGEKVYKLRCIVPVADCDYTSDVRSNAFKIKVDNTANAETPAFNFEFLEYSTFGSASALSPMLYNSTINLSNKGSDEMTDVGVFSVFFWDIPANAPNGGLIQG